MSGSSSSSSSLPSSAPTAAAVIAASSSFLSALDALLETADSDDADTVQAALSEGVDSNGTASPTSSSLIARRLALLRCEPEAELHPASLQDELHAALSSLHQSRLQQAQLRQRLQAALQQQQHQAVSAPSPTSTASLQSLSRSELEEALSSARALHERQLSEVQQQHAEELQHTLQYKLRFAQAQSRLDDLELQLEAERSRTRKSRAVVEKCQQAQRRLEAQEQQLAKTVAKLAQQLITAGIPVKGMDLQPSRSPQPSALSHTPPPALPLPAAASTPNSSTPAVPALPAALQPKGSDAAATLSFSAAELDLMQQILQDDESGKQQQPLPSPPSGQRLAAGQSQSPPPRPAAGASPSKTGWFSSMFSSKQAPSSHAAGAPTQLQSLPAAASPPQPLTAAAAAPH